MDDADLRCGTVYSHRYLNEGLRCLLFNHTSHLCQFLYRASAIAVILALVLCSIFSARRARHVMIFVGGFALVAFLLLS